ncbi:MAG: hypothetical protein OEW98_00255 [Betaproteobacteria bacterium]|nr:hypothetical protein [Betaproteobacteria bacterium]
MQERRAWYAGLCAGCGLEVLAPGPESGASPSITIGAATHALPTWARHPVVRHWPVHHVAFSGQDGFAYRVDEDGVLTRLGVIYGRAAAGWLPDGRACWHDTQYTWRIEADPDPLLIPTKDGSVTGFHGDPTLRRNWHGADDRAPVWVNGLRLFNPVWSPDGAWVAGYHATALTYLVYHRPSDVLYTGGQTHGTPALTQLVLRDDLPVFVRSYPSGLVPFAALAVWTAADEADTLPMPPPVVSPRPPAPLPAPPASVREVSMLALSPAPLMNFVAGDQVPHPDPGFVAVRKPGGRFVCLTPDGVLEDRPTAGAWERFRVATNGAFLVAERDGRTFVVPYVSW